MIRPARTRTRTRTRTRIAADIGGTFTDVCAFDEKRGALLLGKTLTTPRHLIDGILDAMRKAELEAANREMESFSYTVSHDLRSPLRSILGFSGLLAESLEGKLDAETRDYLARIEVSSLRMSRLIDGVLEYSRLARRTLARSDVDLDALAGDVVAELREHYPNSDVLIGQLGHAAADPTMARQILHNLIGNALKYSARSASPRVEIGAEHGGSVAQYFVRDNGVGFDVKYADTLFKLFTRLHSDPAYDGTGVGLAIVKRLLERHHGRIWAEAEVGVGATFRFCLEAA